ncbi:hypothetical protein [Kribbella ginsengisoli]|uniref:Uncharacterized protein n=1 Tax=Kribbella ginsengisoli TaxID=363865 RepID=A0ABP6Z5E8_9ACTN
MADTMMSDEERRSRLVALATQAEAILEALEARSPRGRWAMTAFSRYRVCELLGIAPYGTFVGDLTADPVELLEMAAGEADNLGVPLEDVGWRLAVADALRSAAVDVQMVRNAGEV